MQKGGYLCWVSLISLWVVLTTSFVSFATLGLGAACSGQNCGDSMNPQNNTDYERALLRAEYPILMNV